MSLIKCDNLSLAYDGQKVVSGLSFEVNTGDYLCIVGKNGSGKTTLMKSLLGLHKPVEGRFFFGEGLSNKEIGYMPQQTIAQKDFPASVYEVVISGCLSFHKIRPFYKKEEKALADKNLERLGILNLKKVCYHELSGGQQQRVLLARALCATKRLLVLDEPVAGLDPIVTVELYNIIKKLNSFDNITIIMVSHDIKSAVKYASHILQLESTPLYFGTTQGYISSSVGKRFLGGNND